MGSVLAAVRRVDGRIHVCRYRFRKLMVGNRLDPLAVIKIRQAEKAGVQPGAGLDLLKHN